MYVHIGGECSVPERYLIGVFDLDATTTGSVDTRDFLSRAEREGRLDVLSADIPRTFVVTLDRVFLTPVAAATIRKRLLAHPVLQGAEDEEQGR
jgi:extracellular matrix regulatory protein B